MSTPAPIRWFRPPTEGTPDAAPRRVEVVAVLEIAGESLASCRDLDDPPWHFEVLTPRPIRVGDRGTVRLAGRTRRREPDRMTTVRPRWAFTPEGVTEVPDQCPSSHPISTDHNPLGGNGKGGGPPHALDK